MSERLDPGREREAAHQNAKFSDEWVDKRLERNRQTVQKIVTDFVNSFWHKTTEKMIKIYDELKSDGKYSWLTNSDLRLRAFETCVNSDDTKSFDEYGMKMLELVQQFQKLDWKAEEWRILLQMASWVSFAATRADETIRTMEPEKKENTFFGWIRTD